MYLERDTDSEKINFLKLLRKPEALEASLGQNPKIVIRKGTELVKLIGEMAGIIPLDRKQKKDYYLFYYFFYDKN